MLRVPNLDVSIGPIPIIRNASLDLDEGEMCGLIGRNGAGKTTLLRALMGAIPATGTVELRRRRASGAAGASAASRHGIGYMPEDRRLVPQFTVEENIRLPTWTTADRRRRRAAELDFLDHAGGRAIPRPPRAGAVRRPAEDGGARPRADGGARSCCSTSRSRGWRPRWRAGSAR